MITDRYCVHGIISPTGEYYGDDKSFGYVLFQLYTNKIIEEPSLFGLEDNKWLYHVNNKVFTFNPTVEQINTLFDMLSGEYILLDFVFQDKLIFINELMNSGKVQELFV